MDGWRNIEVKDRAMTVLTAVGMLRWKLGGGKDGEETLSSIMHTNWKLTFSLKLVFQLNSKYVFVTLLDATEQLLNSNFKSRLFGLRMDFESESVIAVWLLNCYPKPDYICSYPTMMHVNQQVLQIKPNMSFDHVMSRFQTPFFGHLAIEFNLDQHMSEISDSVVNAPVCSPAC